MTATFERTATIELNTDAALGVDTLCFATEETGVLRAINPKARFFEHIDSRASDFSCLNTVGLFLFEHDPKKIAGEVVPGTARYDRDNKCRCDVRWHPEKRTIRGEILDGIRDNYFSCGYDWIRETRREVRQDGLHIWFAVKFIEVSCILIGRPADKQAGLYRSFNMKNSLEEAIRIALSGSRKTEGQFTRSELISDFSLVDIIRGGEQQGFNRSVQESAPRHIAGSPVGGAFVRWESLLPLRRDLTAQGGMATGGAFIQTDLHPAIELLHNHVAAIPLGAMVVAGLKGNFAAPRVTSAVDPQVLAEIAAVLGSQIDLDQPALLPKRVSVQVPVSNLLLIQGAAAEDTIRAEIAAAVGVTMDRMILNGQGVGDEPLGIMNTPGVGSVFYGGTVTWNKVLASEKSLADCNADFTAKLGWAVSPTTRNGWKQTPKIAGFPKYIMKEDGTVNGYRSLATNQLSDTHRSVFGNWADLWVLIWGDGLHFTADRVTQAQIGKTIVTATLYFNHLPRHAQSFCVSADSAAQ